MPILIAIVLIALGLVLHISVLFWIGIALLLAGAALFVLVLTGVSVGTALIFRSGRRRSRR